MTAEVEQVADPIVSRQKPLRLASNSSAIRKLSEKRK